MAVESLHQDARIAFRSLGRARGFAALAVVTLAIGIAGTTAMFALVQGVLMRPLPVREQDRLLVAWTQARAGGVAHVPYVRPNIERIGLESTLLEAVSAVSYNGTVSLIVVDEGEPGYLDMAAVGGDFFDVLGVAPMLGRALTRGDDRIGADGAVVISHREISVAPESSDAYATYFPSGENYAKRSKCGVLTKVPATFFGVAVAR